MPRLLCARLPEDPEEERKISKLAGSPHAPGDWILRARIISRSWQGLPNARIAEELGCHPKTVREHLHRFNAEGIDGLGDRPRTGRKPRLTELERLKIIGSCSSLRSSSTPSLAHSLTHIFITSSGTSFGGCRTISAVHPKTFCTQSAPLPSPV